MRLKPHRDGTVFRDSVDADIWLDGPGFGTQKEFWMRADSPEVYVGDPSPDYPAEISRKDVCDMAEAILHKRGLGILDRSRAL